MRLLPTYEPGKDKEFYSDWDDDAGAYCVFGNITGFCYSSHADPIEAKEEAIKRNNNISLLT